MKTAFVALLTFAAYAIGDVAQPGSVDAAHPHGTLVSANGPVVAPGTGYSVGDLESVGEGVEGWQAPATVRITAVNENGGITAFELVEGGEFSTEAGTFTLSYMSVTTIEGGSLSSCVLRVW
jgi:hypothetical protein